MRLGRGLLFAALVVFGATVCARTATAGDDNDLGDDDDDDSAKPDAGAADGGGFGTYSPPVQTIKGHAYTLKECLALADRNFPNLWAARARLAFVHAQLDEAKWTPFSQWSLSSN